MFHILQYIVDMGGPLKPLEQLSYCIYIHPSQPDINALLIILFFCKILSFCSSYLGTVPKVPSLINA